MVLGLCAIFGTVATAADGPARLPDGKHSRFSGHDHGSGRSGHAAPHGAGSRCANFHERPRPQCGVHRLVGRVQPACCTRGWLWVDDLDNPATGASVFYAAGFVTGSDGTANISAHLDADALPRGIDVLLGNGLMPGNVFGAEIHLLIRSHGSLIPWRVAQKIGSVDGACDVNVCAEQQAVGFNAVR